MDIKLSKTNIRKQVGGSLLSTVLTLGRTFAPTIAKTLGLSALGGLASEGASQLVKAISGRGVQSGGYVEPRSGGFLVPQNKIDKLIQYKHLLSTKQKQDILKALQSGSGVHVKPTKTQSGGFLGTLLASIGVPLLLNALTGRTGSGAPRIGKRKGGKGAPRIGKRKGGKGAPRLGMYSQPPPFIGSWKDYGIPVGMGMPKKKNCSCKKKRSQAGKGLLLGKNSPFTGIPLLGAIL